MMIVSTSASMSSQTDVWAAFLTRPTLYSRSPLHGSAFSTEGS